MIATKHDPLYDAMVLDMQISAKRAISQMDLYPHTHGESAKVLLNERLADLAEMGEARLIHDLLAMLRKKGLSL